MTTKITHSIAVLLKKYRQLPYIVQKKHSKLYLLPHRPLKPEPILFRMALKNIEKQIDKYNQYFSPQKLRIKQFKTQSDQSQLKLQNLEVINSQYQPKIPQTDNQTPTIIKDYQALMEQFYTKRREYNQKYKEPLKLMGINAYIIYRKQINRKVRELEQNKRLSDKQQLIAYKNSLRKESKQSQKTSLDKSQANISKANKIYSSVKWIDLTTEQKQVYMDMETKFKQRNYNRIQEFIENHEVPQRKRNSAISRFTTYYSAIHQLSITDPKLYQIYRSLPQSEKDNFAKEAKILNQQSKQKYQTFLKKWNLSEELLKNIIDVSLQYKKTRALKFRESLNKNRQKKTQFYQDQEDFQEDDEDSEIFQDKPLI